MCNYGVLFTWTYEHGYFKQDYEKDLWTIMQLKLLFPFILFMKPTNYGCHYNNWCIQLMLSIVASTMMHTTFKIYIYINSNHLNGNIYNNIKHLTFGRKYHYLSLYYNILSICIMYTLGSLYNHDRKRLCYVICFQVRVHHNAYISSYIMYSDINDNINKICSWHGHSFMINLKKIKK